MGFLGIGGKGGFNLGSLGSVAKAISPLASMIPVVGPLVGMALGAVGGILEGMDSKVSYDADKKQLNLDFANKADAEKAKAKLEAEVEKNADLKKSGFNFSMGKDGTSLNIDDPNGQLLEGLLKLPVELVKSVFGSEVVPAQEEGPSAGSAPPAGDGFDRTTAASRARLQETLGA